MRLDRILANSGLGSRKDVKKLIKNARISLEGEILTDPRQNIDEDKREWLCLDNEPIRVQEWLYYLMHKPAGFLTAMNQTDGTGQSTLGDLVPDFFFHKKIVPVGRLDKDTTGLLLFTNDGTLHHRLLSPKYKIPRTYDVKVDILDHSFNEEDIKAVSQGVDIGSGESSGPGELIILGPDRARLTLYEGKYHEVKRIMEALGKEVTSLHRLSYGPIILGDEKPGQIRLLEPSEIEAIIRACGLDPA